MNAPTGIWFHHLCNLLGRSWIATVTAFGTTTLGFVVWTLLLSAVGWCVNVAASWYKLRKNQSPHPFSQALRESLLAGKLLAAVIGLILFVSYSVFFARTVYQDHQSLVSDKAVLNNKNADLTKQVEVRRHTMVPGDPVFGNTIYLLQAFNIYRHAQNGKPCVILLSAPSDGGLMASMVAQFSNSVSGCFTFGPFPPDSDPDVEKRTTDGAVPNKIVFHAARDDKAADQLFMSLGNLIQLKRSYEMPSVAERTHMYRIPTQGQEDLVWLQFGTNVRWNEQLR